MMKRLLSILLLSIAFSGASMTAAAASEASPSEAQSDDAACYGPDSFYVCYNSLNVTVVVGGHHVFCFGVCL